MAGIIKTDAARNQTTMLIGGLTPAPPIPSYMGVGSGATSQVPARGDTALGTEGPASWTGYARASCPPTQVVGTPVPGDTLQWQTTWTAPAAVTITEVGIFNSPTVGSGVMYIKNVFASGYPLANQDQLILTITEQQL